MKPFGPQRYTAMSAVCAAVGLMSALALGGPALAQSAPTGFIGPNARIGDYVGEDVMVPMRDGVKLHVEIWRPQNAHGPLPILLQRSPYSFSMARVGKSFDTEYQALAKDGFIFVLEDIRGRFGSEGKFIMLHPKAKTGGTDESTDTYDTIDWLVRHVADNNGKVGVFGVSYLGWTTALSTINPHPALKAISVQASPEDMFIGDDFHHNGAFRLDYGWDYATALETDGRTMKAFNFGKDDAYAWYLKQPSLADLDTRELGQTLPTWRNFVAHTTDDAFVRAQVTSSMMPAKVKIPNLIVAGWWDQEDFYGPMTIFKRQEPGDSGHKDFLVVGPWNHGGWVRADGTHYGPYPLGSNTAAYFREQVELPWFKYWLKGEGVLNEPKALVFETGSNEWRRYAAWPPKDGVIHKSLYMHAGGLLSFDPPTRGEGDADRFVSDPADPVPYRERPVQPNMSSGSTWSTWLADDQAPFAKRKDVLSWNTEPLNEDLTIRGDVIAKLFASTTGTDADWVVKLIDVYPSDDDTPAELRGRQLIIADEVFRGRFRKSFVTPHALVPGQVDPYAIDLHTASHVFKKGHRIEVQIQSTWFPLIDRNPQTFVPNIFKAKPAQFKAQTHAVFHTPRHPSAIAIDVASTPNPSATPANP